MAGVAEDDLVLELGAGTGEIGAHLAHCPLRYVGLDDAPAMLAIFAGKVAPGTPQLLVADCNAAWPLPDGIARVIFASRVIHLLHPEHVVREASRVCQAGGSLMLGRVSRDPESPKERLRLQRQHLLRAAGLQPRQGESGARQVIERLVQAGWVGQRRLPVAEWTSDVSASEILAGWETLSRMGSIDVESGTREEILHALREWAKREIGALDRPWPNHEQYVLDIVQRPESAVRQNA